MIFTVIALVLLAPLLIFAVTPVTAFAVLTFTVRFFAVITGANVSTTLTTIVFVVLTPKEDFTVYLIRYVPKDFVENFAFLYLPFTYFVVVYVIFFVKLFFVILSLAVTPDFTL